MILDAAAGMPSKLVKEPSGREPFAVGYDFDGDDWIADVPVGVSVIISGRARSGGRPGEDLQERLPCPAA
jgi:hypothetical protein